MSRSARIPVAVVALLLLVVGTAFAVGNPVAQQHRSPVAASHDPAPSATADEGGDGEGPNDEAPDEDAADGPPSAELVAKVLARLSHAGIETDAATLSGLIESAGVGGAVRLLAWSDASGTSVSNLQQMRADGAGWGEIARQLNEGNAALDLSPGIGWVMGGGHGHGHGHDKPDAASAGKGNGRSTAPGQNKH